MHKGSQPTKKGRFFKRIILLSLVLVLVYGLFCYYRPLPLIQAQASIQNTASTTISKIPWPSYGQAALGVVGYGVLETHGHQKPAPIASIAKVMTALAVLQKKPLELGEQGPVIKITQADVDIYNDYYSKGGSLAKVRLGEKITEYQALQALLLPSANNFADTLAVWAFGSLDNYILYAKQQALRWDLNHTHIADASGFSPQTMSSANDLVLLGQKALANPVIAQIVNQKNAKIPVAGTVHNVNWLLGTDGIDGIKTGNTDEAGGCYLVSATKIIHGTKTTIITAVVGAPNLTKAIMDAQPIVSSAGKNFELVDVIKSDQVIGSYDTPWKQRARIKAKNSLTFLAWRSQPVSITTKFDSITAPRTVGDKVGVITAKVNGRTISTDAVLKDNVDLPSWRWRVFDR